MNIAKIQDPALRKIWSELKKQKPTPELVPISVLSTLTNKQAFEGTNQPLGMLSTIKNNNQQDTNEQPMAFLWISTADIVPLQIWCDLNDKNPSTVRSWKTNGRIIEGKHVFKDPSGYLWISCSAMQGWIESNYNQQREKAEERKRVKGIKIPRGRKPRQTLKTSNTLKVV